MYEGKNYTEITTNSKPIPKHFPHTGGAINKYLVGIEREGITVYGLAVFHPKLRRPEGFLLRLHACGERGVLFRPQLIRLKQIRVFNH